MPLRLGEFYGRAGMASSLARTVEDPAQHPPGDLTTALRIAERHVVARNLASQTPRDRGQGFVETLPGQIMHPGVDQEAEDHDELVHRDVGGKLANSLLSQEHKRFAIDCCTPRLMPDQRTAHSRAWARVPSMSTRTHA